MLNGEYGESDVCLSIPAIIGINGVKATLTPALTDEETAKFKASAEAMKAVIAQVNCNK